MENWEDVVGQIAKEHKEIYQKHFRTIQTRVTRGRIKTVYHFLVVGEYTVDRAKEFISAIDFNTQSTCKINVAFGFILKDIRSEELRFFHPSLNTMLYDLPVAIKNRQDLRAVLEDLEKEDARAYAMAHRPSTVWRMEKIVCVRFDVYKTMKPSL